MTDHPSHALFVSHGAPTLATSRHPAATFLDDLGKRPSRPDAVVVVSAHWRCPVPTVRTAASLIEWHDFGGFPAPLYELRYRPPGAPGIAEHVADLLAAAGLAVERDAASRIDHGVWVPLLRMFPAADVPVVALSLAAGDAAAHLRIGEAIAPLRDRNVLVMGSGGFVHNLGRLVWQESAGPQPWAREFADWMTQAVREGRADDLVAWQTRAPHAASAHPTDEHLLPFFVALGAAGRLAPVYEGYSYGNLAMHAFAG